MACRSCATGQLLRANEPVVWEFELTVWENNEVKENFVKTLITEWGTHDDVDSTRGGRTRTETG